MFDIGRRNTLTITRFSSPGAYLAWGEDGEVLLPGKFVPADAAAGDCLAVFIYTDSEDRLVATTQQPYGMVGEFASLTCVKVTSFGAFLDWGLDKDLFVPRMCQAGPMREGQRYVVYISLDEVSGRVIGLAKLQRFLEERAEGLSRGDAVELLIWDRSDLGYKAVVNNRFSGLLYEDQGHRNIRRGDRLTGYVAGIRPDGKIDLSLSPQGYDDLINLTPVIVETLKKAGGFLPCNAKSDPELIQEHFGMSKKAFKKLIGALYKGRIITVDDRGIHLVKPAD
ncbi:MAG: S1-like domain-containing RNA-binding protein [Lentisphaeria bacterium]|nr:S1-like domain-containing RNA-binding protein [Lentisphaeria bacterium]